MFALQKNTLSFEQHNERFASDCENSKCPPPAFTHAFDLLVKLLTALLMADHLQHLLEFSYRFQFWRKNVNKYDQKFEDKTTT